MNGIQYTIRSIPPKLDKALRQRSKASGKSLNEVVIESLAKSEGLGMSDTFHDLDWFIGSMKPDSQIDEALRWLDSLPKDL